MQAFCAFALQGIVLGKGQVPVIAVPVCATLGRHLHPGVSIRVEVRKAGYIGEDCRGIHTSRKLGAGQHRQGSEHKGESGGLRQPCVLCRAHVLLMT